MRIAADRNGPSSRQQHIFARFRLTEPWRYKAPFLIFIVYFFLYVGRVRFSDALLAAACALCTIAGVAGVGYLSNDVADREEDRRSGRPNATFDLSIAGIVLLFGLFGAAALLPWLLFVPLDRTWAMLLVLEFLLFAVYAVPPFRLKERGTLGLVTDALYAHANPALLAAYTMYLVTGKSYPHARWLLGSLWAWQFFVGLRNILLHQIADADHDRAAGTVTWVTQAGESAAAQLLRAVVAPLEVFGFAIWLAVASSAIPALGALFIIHVAATALAIRHYAGGILNQPLRETLVLFLDDFFVGWMPLVVLGALCVSDWRMAALLLVHIVVFQDRLWPLFRFWLRAVRDVFSGCSPAVRRFRRKRIMRSGA